MQMQLLICSSLWWSFSAVSDFNPEPHTVIFEASAGNADKDVYVEIMDDDLFEEEEFFLVVVEVVNSQASDQVEVERNVTICRLSPDSNDSK